LAFGRDQLTFLEHVHELDALQGCSDRMKGYEPEHWPENPFDRSDDIAQPDCSGTSSDISKSLFTGFLLESFNVHAIMDQRAHLRKNLRFQQNDFIRTLNESVL
jgi:hypothetical protein